jgi:hypothetical protein
MRMGTYWTVIAALIVAATTSLLTAAANHASRPSCDRARRRVLVPRHPLAARSHRLRVLPSPGSRPVQATAPAATQESNACCLLARQMPAHPFMLFGQSDVPDIARRKGRDPLMQECWDRLAELANKPDDLDEWYWQLEARAFVAQITHDREIAGRAIQLMQAALAKTDPDQFYEIGAANFDHHGAPLRSVGAGVGLVLPVHDAANSEASSCPAWSTGAGACLASTNRQLVARGQSYNVGAIPIGALGILALAIRGGLGPPRDRPVAARGLPPDRSELLSDRLETLGHLL